MNFNMNKTNRKPKPDSEAKSRELFRDARELLVTVAVFVIIYILFFRVVVVVGDSMFDTLVDGDRLVLLSSVVYRNPQPGDVIVASKDSFRDGECIVKRVIATEGQTVDIDFENGIVYVDGQALEEEYIYSPTCNPEGITFPLTVDAGCVFVMGDNRMDSMDSRHPVIGQIDKREILGKAIFLLFPGDDEGAVKRDFGRIGGVG